MIQSDILAQLNPRQKEAAETIEGPVLIMAGPGSGKTRLITHRIAYLVKVVGVSPRRIAAVTFTNKAAREMRNRLESLLSYHMNELTVTTFHSFCSMVLRRDGGIIGLDKNFVIYDDTDQLNVIKRSMSELDIDPKRFEPRAIKTAISKSKSNLVNATGFGGHVSNYFEEITGRVFEHYEQLMSQFGAVDFDDLLLKAHRLLTLNSEVLTKYQERYIHFMIDEFQDTNVVQYAIASKITEIHRNLCVVGDPDQSIYSWRNADIRNILGFHDDFPEAKIISLEQNYRSTQTILDAADSLIGANPERIDRKLFTDNGTGVPIVVGEGYDEQNEAQLVLKEISELTGNTGAARNNYQFADIAVMYRVNAQSRVLEEECVRYGIPYQIIGGQKFWNRQEVKDVIAYLRLVANPRDEVSLNRIINVPARGIGRRTMDGVARMAHDLGVSHYDAVQKILHHNDPSSFVVNKYFAPRAIKALKGFITLVDGLQMDAEKFTLVDFIEAVMERSGYRTFLTSDAERGEERIENISQLKIAATEFQDLGLADGLTKFLEKASLHSDLDDMKEREDVITLITLHQAKGLEFPVVFIVGMEEGLLPHARSMEDQSELEEERRLAYVGVTRAKERLYLMRAFRRGFQGNSSGSGPRSPSRFLQDIPDELVIAPGRKGSEVSITNPTDFDSANGAREFNQLTPPKNGFGFNRNKRPLLAPDVRKRKSTPNSQTIASRLRSKRPATDENTAHVFKTGDKVSHPIFGEGIVMSCMPSGADFKVKVFFKDGHGEKDLLMSFAKLTIVE